MTPASKFIARLLSEIGDDTSFATHFSIRADPGLRVAGIGAVPLPVTVQMAHRLCAVAQPALHGYKDQTRLDPRVRDTWEVPASAINCGSPQWQATLDDALARIKVELGLPPELKLEAEPHNLLVYAPGQFFAVHQDSEKADGMLGTMVITLPSSFTGGEFQVSHQGETLTTRGSADRLDILAFYADCHHEVRPVKQGYRVAMTYNLVAHGNALPAEISVQNLTALGDALRAFWNTPSAPRWGGAQETQAPDRLIYLLDHQYTQSGLSWARLKGADAARAHALLKVADQLDAEIFLALADVHETWSAEEAYQEYENWHYEDDDAGLEDIDPSEPVLQDLIDSDIELRHWLARDGGIFNSDNSVAEYTELCLNRASSDCTPFKSEYEGYMGNYGNTVDRWYHRAAVVMWPRERAFIIRARQSPRWAIQQIAGKLEAGDETQANTLAHGLLPFWDKATRNTEKAPLLSIVLPVIARVDDDNVAARLLAPFSLPQLAPEMVPPLLTLLERHGRVWCEKLLRNWTASHHPPPECLEWLAQTLPAVVNACAHANVADSRTLAASLIENRWNWLQEHFSWVRKYHPGSSQAQELENTGPALLGLLRSSHDGHHVELQKSIVDTLLSAGPSASLGVLRAAVAQPSDDLSSLNLAPLHAYCVQSLTERLAQPERAPHDWSIPAPALSSGELGKTLALFLESSERKRLEWPLAKDKRQIIHQYIGSYELPLSHETRRTGRPYTLVLEKTQDVFEREAVERRRWSKDLAWLHKAADRFAAS
ncbi:MAG: 2OG-Fe(II) oxygenase [Burkholderiaceae bacterium]